MRSTKINYDAKSVREREKDNLPPLEGNYSVSVEEKKGEDREGDPPALQTRAPLCSTDHTGSSRWFSLDPVPSGDTAILQEDKSTGGMNGMEDSIPHMTWVREKEKKEMARMRYGLHDDGGNEREVESRKSRNEGTERATEKKDPLTLR